MKEHCLWPQQQPELRDWKQLFPVAPNTSYYHYYRSNGLVRSPGGYLGEDIDVLFDFIHSGALDKRAYAREHVRDTEMKKWSGSDYRRLQRFFGAGRDYLNDMEPIACSNADVARI